MNAVEANARLLTVGECLIRLEQLDKQLEASTDNRVWRRLKASRDFFAEQLQRAQAREESDQTEVGVCQRSKWW